MSEAPERIWVKTRGVPKYYEFPCEDLPLLVEYVRADRIEELEAKNKRLNEQMDAIEEMGTESLNALPDCLMRLAPALVENDELKAKLEKVTAFLQDQTGAEWPYSEDAKDILAELRSDLPVDKTRESQKGDSDE